MKVCGCDGITVLQDFNVNIQTTADFALLMPDNEGSRCKNDYIAAVHL